MINLKGFFHSSLITRIRKSKDLSINEPYPTNAESRQRHSRSPAQHNFCNICDVFHPSKLISNHSQLHKCPSKKSGHIIGIFCIQNSDLYNLIYNCRSPNTHTKKDKRNSNSDRRTLQPT